MLRLLIGAAMLGSIAIATQAAPAEPTLDEVRARVERFRDVRAALAAGYVPDPNGICETAGRIGQPAALGAMGIHYFRPDLLGITSGPGERARGTGTHTDFRDPAILLYEPQADGSLELVGVENLVFADAWHAAGHSPPPSFHGRPYERMEDDPATAADEAHGVAPHYDRHVWLFRANPNGVFAPFNPNVTCAHARSFAPDAAHAGHAPGQRPN